VSHITFVGNIFAAGLTVAAITMAMNALVQPGMRARRRSIGRPRTVTPCPDGHTLLASFNSTVSISDYLFKGLGYDPLGFEPVSVLTQIPLALVVRADFPAADAKGFVAYAKANPRKLTYASNGVGTAGHLTAELFMALT
jgi:tripartite-type tricarboxylate transporter receptor subunit TctC